MQRHRHQEFIRFLNEIERTVPTGKLIHVVLDTGTSNSKSAVTSAPSAGGVPKVTRPLVVSTDQLESCSTCPGRPSLCPPPAW
jgi:hypothetical protein